MAGFAAVKRGIMSHLWVIAPFLVIAFFTGLTAIFEWYVWIPAWAAGGYGMYKYLLPEVSSALKPAAARVKPVTKADEERVKQIASSFEAELLEEEEKEKAKQKAKDDKAKAAKLAALKEVRIRRARSVHAYASSATAFNVHRCALLLFHAAGQGHYKYRV